MSESLCATAERVGSNGASYDSSMNQRFASVANLTVTGTLEQSTSTTIDARYWGVGTSRARFLHRNIKAAPCYKGRADQTSIRKRWHRNILLPVISEVGSRCANSSNQKENQG